MNIFHSAVDNIRYLYNNMNSATLSGAIDVVVVEQPDGSLLSTPFHVRFGKYGVFNSNEKYIDIMINGEEIKVLKMKLGENGIAYFVQETEETDFPAYLASSPVPGSLVDSYMDENVRKLKKQQKRESRKDYEKKRNPGGSESVSRSPSPTPRMSRNLTFDKNLDLDKFSDMDKTPEAAPTQQEIDQKAKMKLAFSSSIFSTRRYRSLPDLSSISNNMIHTESTPAFQKCHMRKMTLGNLNPNDTSSLKPLSFNSTTSRSLSSPKKSEDLLKPERRSFRIEDGIRTEPTTPVKSVTFAGSEDSDSDGSTTAGTGELQNPTIGKKPSSANLDMIADGALSDSEVDRTRNNERNNDTVWKWGQFPESSKQQKKEQPAKSDSYWNWFSWGKPAEPKEEGVYLTDLMNKDNSKELEKYLGTQSAPSIGSSTADSGNGHSAVSPASPSALSMDSLNSDVTDASTPTMSDVKKAFEKSVSGKGIPIESGKLRQKSGTSTSEASGLSDDEPSMGRTKYIRSLRLSSDELKSLELEYGPNEARFSITTKFQGTSWCSCHIYLFKYTEKLVISDIDGTITKSDVLGHVIPAIGGQWAHAGVAELYTRIKENGYKVIYLSSRAIGQSHYTKNYLQSLAQGSRNLPDGPVLLSPTSVLMAFRKEVIERRPEEFKIACLSDLKALFPVKHPFYAGFGNRETDVKSYASVDIPPERILIINPSGDVRRADHIGFVSSYSSMAVETVDYLFPPLLPCKRKLSYDGEVLEKAEKMSTNFTKPETCSSFTHWRTVPEEIVQVEDELANYEKRRKEMAEQNKRSAKKKK
ncbi:hypothetical protein FO519_007787 [Halicephalobus sp. NKZ332]|nr:hypothetical protein FO519_007787 [Halicephalobus sp. NKZ332]